MGIGMMVPEEVEWLEMYIKGSLRRLKIVEKRLETCLKFIKKIKEASIYPTAGVEAEEEIEEEEEFEEEEEL